MAWDTTLDCARCSDTYWGDSETERICPICGGVLTMRVSETHQKAVEQSNDCPYVVKHQHAQGVGFFTRRGVLRLSDELRLSILSRWREKSAKSQEVVRTSPKVGVQ